MRYRAFACDYDATLAVEDRADAAALAAVRRLKQAGYVLVLVTGRQLDDLRRIFSAVGLFDRVVAENGALFLTPASGAIRLLGGPPPPAFAAELERRGVSPLSAGQVIVATDRPNEQIVGDVIRNLGLDLRVIFNKNALMVLPSGIDKASGLGVALADLGVTFDQTVGIGDAENDVTFLDSCGLSAAVANALDSVKTHVDLVTTHEAGAGVVELVERLIPKPS